MTRIAHTIALLSILLATAGAIGCASDGSGVQVATADLDAQHVELVEVHGADGLVEVELYFEDRESGETVRSVHEWPQTEAPPRELVDRLSEIDPELLQRIEPINDEASVPTVEVVWPVLLEHAGVALRVDIDTGCAPWEGISDCARAR